MTDLKKEKSADGRTMIKVDQRSRSRSKLLDAEKNCITLTDKKFVGRRKKMSISARTTADELPTVARIIS